MVHGMEPFGGVVSGVSQNPCNTARMRLNELRHVVNFLVNGNPTIIGLVMCLQFLKADDPFLVATERLAQLPGPEHACCSKEADASKFANHNISLVTRTQIILYNINVAIDFSCKILIRISKPGKFRLFYFRSASETPLLLHIDLKMPFWSQPRSQLVQSDSRYVDPVNQNLALEFRQPEQTVHDARLSGSRAATNTNFLSPLNVDVEVFDGQRELLPVSHADIDKLHRSYSRPGRLWVVLWYLERCLLFDAGCIVIDSFDGVHLVFNFGQRSQHETQQACNGQDIGKQQPGVSAADVEHTETAEQ
ncbi:hypothetical protein OGATHE_004295 [Ogataea polymorpha]|uniref:Uncharacterized protein n=1 Tax=Ogataea polymorpha TaxID=460523 RepID=A0A9P8T218_9ASCO|nr:hypothetical protein OGATHE_004295 [Ogataea polymorpha]